MLSPSDLALSQSGVRAHDVASRAKAAGVEGRVSGFTPVGAAQSLAAAGVSLVDMQQASRWSHDRLNHIPLEGACNDFFLL